MIHTYRLHNRNPMFGNYSVYAHSCHIFIKGSTCPKVSRHSSLYWSSFCHRKNSGLAWASEREENSRAHNVTEHNLLPKQTSLWRNHLETFYEESGYLSVVLFNFLWIYNYLKNKKGSVVCLPFRSFPWWESKKGAYCQGWQPKCSPKEPHGRGRELSTARCPLLHMQIVASVCVCVRTLACSCARVHARTHTHIHTHRVFLLGSTIPQSYIILHHSY